MVVWQVGLRLVLLIEETAMKTALGIDDNDYDDDYNGDADVLCEPSCRLFNTSIDIFSLLRWLVAHISVLSVLRYGWYILLGLYI